MEMPPNTPAIKSRDRKQYVVCENSILSAIFCVSMCLVMTKNMIYRWRQTPTPLERMIQYYSKGL